MSGSLGAMLWDPEGPLLVPKDPMGVGRDGVPAAATWEAAPEAGLLDRCSCWASATLDLTSLGAPACHMLDEATLIQANLEG